MTDNPYDLSPDLLSALDAYAAHADGQPSRAELIRRIIKDWLSTNGYLQRSAGEGLRPDQLTTEHDG